MMTITLKRISVLFFFQLMISAFLSAQDFGFILLKSQPDNASVIIDGQDTGERTPYQARLNTGTYYYRLSLDNYYTYEGQFEILAGKTTTIEDTLKPAYGNIMLRSDPTGAKIFLNDNDIGEVTPYQGILDVGSYRYRLVKDDYHVYEGSFEINSEKTTRLDNDLKPAFGTLVINTNPQGATIYINDLNTRETTPASLYRIPSGKHTLLLEKESYHSLEQDFEIEDEKTTRLTLDLVAGYGTVGIRIYPDDAGIYVDGSFKKTGFYSGQLSAGTHEIEFKLDKYYTERRWINITEGSEERISDTLNPIMGSISIMVDPPETRVYLDGEYKGLSPLVIPDLLIGEYKLELREVGFANLKKNVEVKENQVTSLNEKMFDGYNIRLESDPDKALVIKDGKEIGITPADIILLPGNHLITLQKQFYFDKLLNVSPVQNNQVFRTTLDRANTDVVLKSNVPHAYVTLTPKNDNLEEEPLTFSIPGRKTFGTGAYELTISSKGYKTIKEEVELEIGEFVQTYILHPEKYRTKGGALWRSVLWPGAGQNWIKRRGAEQLIGFAAWGTLAGGIYMYFETEELYRDYKVAGTAYDRERLFEEKEKSERIRNILFISSGIVWGANLIWTMTLPSEEKRYQKLELTGQVDPYSGGMQVGFVVRR